MTRSQQFTAIWDLAAELGPKLTTLNDMIKCAREANMASDDCDDDLENALDTLSDAVGNIDVERLGDGLDELSEVDGFEATDDTAATRHAAVLGSVLGEG